MKSFTFSPKAPHPSSPPSEGERRYGGELGAEEVIYDRTSNSFESLFN